MSDSPKRLRGAGVTDRVDFDPLSRLSAWSPVSTRALAGLCALVPAALATLYRIVHNAPGALPSDLVSFATGALPVVVAGPALAGLLLAANEEHPVPRVGLAFAGGFGVVAALSPAAWLPAAVGTTAGGAVVVGARIARPGTTSERVRTAAVGGVLVAAVGLSLLATVGVGSATLRPLGSAVALVGVAATPLVVGHDRTSLLAGTLAGLLTFGVATSAPYVAGAVLLVGGDVVGVPLGVVALAVAGAVAGVVAALDRRRDDAALGVALLLVAGVPATLLGAVTVVVAVALLTTPAGRETAASRRDEGGVPS